MVTNWWEPGSRQCTVNPQLEVNLLYKSTLLEVGQYATPAYHDNFTFRALIGSLGGLYHSKKNVCYKMRSFWKTSNKILGKFESKIIQNWFLIEDLQYFVRWKNYFNKSFWLRNFLPLNLTKETAFDHLIMKFFTC